MSRTIAVVEAATAATVQDGGRRGFEDVGVPVSGAWHRGRYLTATALLAGVPDASVPSIEILGGQLRIRLETDAVVGVVGPASVLVDDRRAAGGTLIHVRTDTRLTVVAAGRGPTYAVVAGWEPQRTLGSASVDTFSGLGGRAMRSGDRLQGALAVDEIRVGVFHRAEPDATGPLRVVASSHPAAGDFVQRRWHVESVARSGVRLRTEGWVPRAESVASMPVLPGAIQLTPDGEAIILGPDGGLTGGYPVVGVVASAELDRVSLLAPGDVVAFAGILPAAAADSFQQWSRRLSRSLAHPSDLT